MPWQHLLIRRERLPANSDLGEGYATLLHHLGTVTPFDLAVAGADDGDAGAGISGGVSSGVAHVVAERAFEPRCVVRH